MLLFINDFYPFFSNLTHHSIAYALLISFYRYLKSSIIYPDLSGETRNTKNNYKTLPLVIIYFTL